MNGLIHIYAGDGKGKTTAAIGLALRFAYYERKVAIIQFLKDGSSGEFNFIKNLKSKYIDIFSFDKKRPFFWLLDEKEKLDLKTEENRALDYAFYLANGNVDMIVLDEIIDSVNNKLIDKQQLINFLYRYKNKIEIVMTGRNPDNDLIELADYYSDIKMIKHPYEKGIVARKGIEF